MNNRKKTKALTFADYGLTLLLSILCSAFFGGFFEYTWGRLGYSILMSLILFSLLYGRAHKTARTDLLQGQDKLSLTGGLKLVLPLACVSAFFVLVYALLEFGILPGRDMIVKTLYLFPDNAPRVAESVYLLDYLTPIFRIWFAYLAGFLTGKADSLVFLISPVLILLAGFSGYAIGRRKIYISDFVARADKKLRDKFNE